jgi:hypothetical protein
MELGTTPRAGVASDVCSNEENCQNDILEKSAGGLYARCDTHTGVSTFYGRKLKWGKYHHIIE